MMYTPNRIFLTVMIIIMFLTGTSLAQAAPGQADRGQWAPNVSYAVNDTVTYNGVTYKCLQAHTSLTGWEPVNVPALWEVVNGTTNTPGNPTITPTRTNTPGNLTNTPTRTNTPSGPTPTQSGNNNTCWPAWSADTVYNGGSQVSRNGQNYQAAWWTQGNDPATHSGPSGSGQPWILMGACGGGANPTVTPTRTNTPGPATSTPSRTFTPPYTATSTSTSMSSGTTCAIPWNAATQYVVNNIASDNGHNYRANWWNQNERPSTSSSGVWTDLGECTAPTPGPTAQPGNVFPDRVSAIYADVSFTSIQAAYQATGQKYYALAFVLAHAGTCEPAWDGTHLMNENYYSSQINTIRAGGGDVIAVFGGANGYELGSVCNSVGSLQGAYQAVLDQYDFNWIDLNIEGGMISNTVAIDRINKAVKAAQDANPDLKVSYTLPVLQSGLPQGELNVLNNAKSNGVRIDYVNVMTMNYGPASIDMGQAAIDAATNTHNQLISLGIPAKIGVTPMIGQNNTQGEIFTLEDAGQLLTYARANAYVGWLSFWSLGRDNGGCPGQIAASPTCSGISQSNWAFTNVFKAFP